MIDLHLHTTASDGTLAPAMLVARAASAGLTIISVTDHDTVAGLAEAREAAGRLRIRLVTGIEITAVAREKDVHVLAYFFDAGSAPLLAFLERQRAHRLERVRETLDRLATLGMPIDGEAILRAGAGRAGRSVGRPQIADALVAAGHVSHRGEAFDRWLGFGRPAFVAREGPSPEEVFRVIRTAGGVPSLAHPGLLRMDDQLETWTAGGLTALEAYHSDHDAETSERYRALAARLGLAVSGGSDFHGEGLHRTATLGSVTLSAAAFAALESRAS